jgi:imidazolonepropionase-like amidohydrolase
MARRSRFAMRWLASFVLLASFGPSGAGPAADSIVLRASKLYVSPDSPVVNDAVVVIRNGRVVSAGPAATVRVPKGARESECPAGVVTAGFQNSHVHFMEARWNDAAQRPARELEQGLEEMLTRFGVTTAFDTGSDQSNTLALRARVEAREVRGPRIFTVGIPLYPPNGIPFYIRDMPPEVLAKLHQPPGAQEARDAVRGNLATGADATKLFMVTSPDGKSTLPLSLDVARAAAEETHARGKLVFAHPTSLQGIRNAIDAGVDILVHTTLGEPAPWDADVVRQMTAKRMSVIPTFKLWIYELRKQNVPQNITDNLVNATLQELRNFIAGGGQVLFGTDVGYMHEYDPTDEYRFMAKAGMSPMQILASLTTAPAARWNESRQRGQVAKGYEADLVVLAADPADDVANFARVRCTIRGGTPIYRAP